MNVYEISLLPPYSDESGVRIFRVSASYIEQQPSLNAQQKAAIRALPVGGVWQGHALQIKRLDTPALH